MQPTSVDPIIAVATAPGRGAIGVVRMSGRGLSRFAAALCGQELRPRHAHYLAVRDADGQVIDRGIALFFAAPHSFTGEDVLELQMHGGPVVLQLLVARCLEVAAAPVTAHGRLIGLRLAEPGEFTQRAYQNDKVDLAQAEAVADMIAAQTDAAARAAARVLDGVLSTEVHRAAEQLVELRSLVEATLDFPDEEHEFLRHADAQGRLARIADALDGLMARGRQGTVLRDGLRIVIAGQPNVGKSSLLNALAGVELAIVSPTAGTTRDRITEVLHVDGVPLHISDTAGLRTDATDDIEQLGIARAWASVQTADVVVFLHDLSRNGDLANDAADAAIRRALPVPAVVLDVFNKADLAKADAAWPDGAVIVSARTGEGLEALRARLLDHAGRQPLDGSVLFANARQLHELTSARQHLTRAASIILQASADLELLAEELRLAHLALGAITGHVNADGLLGHIFGRFCIGK